MTDYRKFFDLTGKTAVVLGAASGIGKSSAEALASLGARVMCADRSGEGAEATAAAIRAQGGSAISARCDAADSADIAALAANASEAFPRIDIAVTTPGLNIRKTILSTTPRTTSTASSTSTSRAPSASSRRSAASWSSNRPAA